jgi:hypothetical protein
LLFFPVPPVTFWYIFLPNPLQFIILLSPFHSTVYRLLLKSVVK